MTIKELIACLESATDGNIQMDEAVARYFARHHYEWWRDRLGPANFTQSIDAALTLLPAGFAVTDFRIWPGQANGLTVLGTKLIDGEY